MVPVFLLLGTAVAAAPVDGESVVLPRSHAHNDYEHDHPLRDALDHGFVSVEADIHLVDGELLVAHDADEVQPGRTLQKLYLDPLRTRVTANNGRVYTEFDQPLLLLIDFKSCADATYPVLRNVLRDYEAMLATVQAGAYRPGAVQVVISGKRPVRHLRAEESRLAFLDGRIHELIAAPPATLVPLISDNGGKRFDWRPDGTLPADQIIVLRALVSHIQAAGHKVRFWATPDKPATWQILQEAGVDLINTDDLAGLRQFLRSQTR
jgi:glycerophosphoryl diester phosphodiesterase